VVARSEHRVRTAARVAAQTETIRIFAGPEWRWSDPQIAKHMGCSRHWVWLLRHRAGIPPAHKPTGPVGRRPARGRFDLEDTGEL
jgi:hypothetical protein